MFQHKFNEEVGYRIYIDWFILSFLAGNINAGGYLASHYFVSHVTGFATLTGIKLEQTNWTESFGALMIPLFFLFGVVLSGYLTEKKYAHKENSQRYAPVMWLVSIILLFVTLAGQWGWFGRFGDVSSLKHDFILLACLCGACGLQNAAITSSSDSTFRTTHLTGITTDLGLGLVNSEIKLKDKNQIRTERKANGLRLLAIFSFILGSAVGAFVYMKFNYLGFLLPMLISFYSAVRASRTN